MAKFKILPAKKLSGVIPVYGAKNAAIKMIAGSLLLKGETILDNIPDILDIQKIIRILEKLGVSFHRDGHRLKISTQNLRPGDPDPKLVSEIRASVVLVGPLLSRFSSVNLPHPGGCTIGQRPIDRHLQAFRHLGADVDETKGYYHFQMPETIKNRPVKVKFSEISVTATENVLLFGALQERLIEIENAALEPEVIDLIEFLKKAGVEISLNGRRMAIRGRRNLSPVKHRVIPDRIEAGTFGILAAATKSSLKIIGLIPEHLENLLDKFQKMGVQFERGGDFLYIKKSPRLKALDIATAPFPGFPTDLQPPMGVLLTQAAGISRLKENIFSNRLEYLGELQKMGARIKISSSREAKIYGPKELNGDKIESLDLRAGATLLIAGLTAKYGETVINHAENIDRGYEKIEERLQNIGANIQRVQ